MPQSISLRVSRRFLSTSKMATIVHHDRDGVAWGWLSQSAPRMHLVPIDPVLHGVALVWLEDADGTRCFRPDPRYAGVGIDFGALRASIARTRDTVESAWLQTCERKGWLDYLPREATIALYRGTARERTVRLGDDCYRPEFLQLEVSTNSACLEVRLNRLIWRGADDGSDAVLSESPRRGAH